MSVIKKVNEVVFNKEISSFAYEISPQILSDTPIEYLEREIRAVPEIITDRCGVRIGDWFFYTGRFLGKGICSYAKVDWQKGILLKEIKHTSSLRTCLEIIRKNL